MLVAVCCVVRHHAAHGWSCSWRQETADQCPSRAQRDRPYREDGGGPRSQRLVVCEPRHPLLLDRGGLGLTARARFRGREARLTMDALTHQYRSVRIRGVREDDTGPEFRRSATDYERATRQPNPPSRYFPTVGRGLPRNEVSDLRARPLLASSFLRLRAPAGVTARFLEAQAQGESSSRASRRSAGARGEVDGDGCFRGARYAT